MKTEDAWVDGITVGDRLRRVDPAAVDVLAESMSRLGLLQPISLYFPDSNTAILVTGAHRLAAAKKLGWDFIDAFEVTGTEIELQLQEIAENLHRSELTALERSNQIARWAELTAAKVLHSATPVGGHQPSEKGIRKVARELGLETTDVHRAVKVAGISQPAQQAALEAKLDDNRAALLTVAREATAEAQVAKVAQLAAAKETCKEVAAAPKPPIVADGEIRQLATALRTGLSALGPILDRIQDIGLQEFWRGVEPMSARNELHLLLDDTWRLEVILKAYIDLTGRGKIYSTDTFD